jgi:hypothetical protein
MEDEGEMATCTTCGNDRWIYSERTPVRAPCPTCTNGWPRERGEPITLRAPYGSGPAEAVGGNVPRLHDHKEDQ